VPAPSDRPRTPAWEGFARADARLYIDPRLGRKLSPAEFLASGRALVERELEWSGLGEPLEHAVEIGCGIGRYTIHLAERFTRVDAIDVSETMVRLAEEHGMPGHVSLHVGSGRDLAPVASGSADLVFSHLVFQHIADETAIAGYLAETARVLKPGGAAVLQFDTRPTSVPLRLVQHLPDALLPSTRRRGIRRYRRDAARLRELAEDAGLSLQAQRDPGTAEHWFRWGAGGRLP
jgi:ubiquinone/menaquinone biosynthesis C-methylase UbiE